MKSKIAFIAARTAGRSVLGWPFLSLCVALPIHAARPLQTDDARVVDGGQCQVESWSVSQTGTREFWALPACSGGAGIEWALGGQKSRHDRQADTAHTGVGQYKRMLRELTPGGVGVAFAVGSVLSQGRALPYFYMPISWMSRGEGSVIHLNVGGASNEKRTLADRTWGLGLEQQVTESTWLIAERYSPSASQWQAQAGVRWWVLPGRLQLDTTAGHQHTGLIKVRFTSVGLRWIFPQPF